MLKLKSRLTREVIRHILNLFIVMALILPASLFGADCIAESDQSIQIHPGLPEYKFKISARLSSFQKGMRGGIHKIEVFDNTSSPLQTILITDADDPTLMIEGSDCSTAKPVIHDPDINFDGFRDIAVIVEWGAKFTSMNYWMFDPASRRFITNGLTKELATLADVEFDDQQKMIYTTYIGPYEPSISTYKIVSGKLIFETRKFLDSDGFLVTEEGTQKVRKVTNKHKPTKEEEEHFWSRIHGMQVE